MNDELRTRIAAVYNAHSDPFGCSQCSREDVDGWAKCDCGERIYDYSAHLADAVIRELEAGYVLVPKNVTLVQWADEAFQGQTEGKFKHERITEWIADE